jgi:hypothetical protein
VLGLGYYSIPNQRFRGSWPMFKTLSKTFQRDSHTEPTQQKKRLASFVGPAVAREVLATFVPFGAQSVRETAARTSRAGGRGASVCSRYPGRPIAEDGVTTMTSIYGVHINLYYTTLCILMFIASNLVINKNKISVTLLFCPC